MRTTFNNRRVNIQSICHNALHYTASYVEEAYYTDTYDELDDDELEQLTDHLIDNGDLEAGWHDYCNGMFDELED